VHRPYVSLFVVSSLRFDYLWCHPAEITNTSHGERYLDQGTGDHHRPRGPDKGLPVSAPDASLAEEGGNPEVSEVNVTLLVNQDVSSLDIPVPPSHVKDGERMCSPNMEAPN